MKVQVLVCVALMAGGVAVAKPSAVPAGAGTHANSAASGAMSGTATIETRHAASRPAYDKLAEVLVTADKRTTDLQTTPVAATVLTGTQLLQAGVINVDQLETVSPSLSVANHGQGNEFNIRGIGKSENNTQTQAGVVTYRDGVATFPANLEDEPYFDISNIQVLRGPQGTFAGENSTGGAVYITETPPDFHGVHGYVIGQYGNYNDVMLQGAVNLPIDKTWSSRIAFYSKKRSSFFHITGPYTGNDGSLKQGSFRFSLLWRPSRRLSAIWRNDYSYIDNGGYPASPATAKTPLFDITANGPMAAIDQIARTTLNINYTFRNGITLRSITGGQYGRTLYEADLDGTDRLPFVFKDLVPIEMYSQEFDLISPAKGFLTWVTGIYYQGLDYSYPIGRGYYLGYPPGVFDEYIEGRVLNDTAAAFGQVSFHFHHGVKLQIGLRYSWNDSTNRVHVLIPEFRYNAPDHQTLHNGRVTGKAALSWAVNKNNYLYTFVATGYKQGGLNLPIGFTLQKPFGAEYVTDYEAGWKASALNDHLRTQLDGYYDKYDNFQVVIGDPTIPVKKLEVNDPSPTTLYGFEASLQALLGHLSINANASIEHTSLGKFFATDTRIRGTQACFPLSGPASASCVNLNGHPTPHAPKVTYNVSAQYVFDIGGTRTLTTRANFSHVGAQWATVFDNAPLGDFLASRDLLSAQVALGIDKWTITAYGTNLTNDHYVSAMIAQLRFAGAPRQYGIRFMRTF